MKEIKFLVIGGTRSLTFRPTCTSSDQASDSFH